MLLQRCWWGSCPKNWYAIIHINYCIVWKGRKAVEAEKIATIWKAMRWHYSNHLAGRTVWSVLFLLAVVHASFSVCSWPTQKTKSPDNILAKEKMLHLLFNILHVSGNRFSPGQNWISNSSWLGLISILKPISLYVQDI